MEKDKSFQPRILFKQRIILISLGIFLFFVLLEASLRLGGFILLSIQEHRNLQSIKQKGTYRILCLGESTTQGQYPSFLEQALNQNNIGIRFSIVDKGRGGTDTRTILSQVESYLDEYHPDMVVAMMGINDYGKEYISPQAIANSKTALFFKSFKTYKLTRLLWLHILNKTREVGLYNPDSDKRYLKKIQTSLPEIWLKEASSEPISREEVFKKALALNPKNDNVYFELGKFYHDQGEYSQAEVALKQAIEINPKNETYVELGWLYRHQGKFLQAENILKKAIELNPKNDGAYVELGRLWHVLGEYAQAKDAYKKALEFNPTNEGAYAELGEFYHDQGEYAQAKDAYKKALELNPTNDYAYGAMSALCEELSKSELAKEYASKARMLRSEHYIPATVNNYHKLKEILDQRGIRFVCVQYPMRDLELLKRIFKQDEDIIFVDNESVFREALKKASYKEYFMDMFGGDFGHCTEKGNKLLAQNIANVILKEVFNK